MGLYVGWFGLCAPTSRSVRGRASGSLGAREHLERQDRSICGGRRRAQTVKLKLRSRRCERRDRGRGRSRDMRRLRKLDSAVARLLLVDLAFLKLSLALSCRRADYFCGFDEGSLLG
eukprot:scaffold99220_cov57-Phaeocystis_antarctica.AAC.1